MTGSSRRMLLATVLLVLFVGCANKTTNFSRLTGSWANSSNFYIQFDSPTELETNVLFRNDGTLLISQPLLDIHTHAVIQPARLKYEYKVVGDTIYFYNRLPMNDGRASGNVQEDFHADFKLSEDGRLLTLSRGGQDHVLLERASR